MNSHVQVWKFKIVSYHAIRCVQTRAQHAEIEAQAVVDAQFKDTLSDRVCGCAMYSAIFARKNVNVMLKCCVCFESSLIYFDGIFGLRLLLWI